MTISAFDLNKIGIDPSSSHTVGPMRAAKTFVTRLEAAVGDVNPEPAESMSVLLVTVNEA